MEGELRKVMVRETERQRAAWVLTNIIKINKKCSRNILHLAIVLDQLLKLFEDS